MIVIKINYSSVSPVVNVNYDESPIYVRVMYGGAGDSITEWGEIIGTLSNQTDLQNALNAKVPYSGATANVDLGEYELKAGQIELDQSPTGVAGVAVTRWNDTIGSTETTLKGGSVILKNGVDLVARVVNKVSPNTTLTKAAYQAVRISGAQGQRLAVAFAQANNDNNSADTIGLVTETIATNQEGFIMTVGSLEGINTTGSLQGETWSDGDVLYLSPTVAGAITNIKPVAPQHLVVIGYVEYAHQNNGKIYVKVMNGWELGELHDVNTNGATNGQVLTYNGSIWVPSTNGVGTVTSVDMTVPTGLTVSGNPITSSGTLALGLASGYSIPTDANQTNWTAAYNDKINSAAVTGTTTKTLTLNQQDGGTITASWTDYDTAPVTSVFGRTGAVVATSGDYTTDQVTEGTNLYFTDARARAAISLTTTGTSGAATYVGGVLNIPQYQAALTNPITGTGTAGQLAYWSGTNTQTGSSTFLFTPTSELDLANSVTAATAIARGARIRPTLTAAANNDVLVGLDIQPTFTIGAFTGVSRFLARFNNSYFNNDGNLFINPGSNGIGLQVVASSGSNFSYFDVTRTQDRYILSARNTGTGGASTELRSHGSTYSETIDGLATTGASILFATPNTSSFLLIRSGGATPIIFANNGAERARYTSSGNLLVGTTTDGGQRLQVSGTASVSSSITATSFIPSGSTVPTNGMYLPTTNTLAWATNTTERMRLDSSGNLGIGMTPSYRLDITSPSGTWEAARLTAGGNHPVLMRFVGGGGGSVDFGSDSAASVGIIRTGGNERVRIDANGNLGIGTTLTTKSRASILSSGGALPVLGQDVPTSNLFLTQNNTWGMYIGLESVSGKGYIQQMRNDSATSYPLLLQPVGGNLLVGVTSDIGEKLQLNGNVILTSGYKIYGNTNTGLVSSYISLYNPTDGGIDLMANFTTSKITFGTFGSERARFTAAGNLLVGTTTDGGQRLQVTGTGYFSDSLGIGTTNLTGFSLNVSKNVTGATTCYGIAHGGVVQSDVTNAFNGYLSNAITAAATFTLTTYRHFYANQGTIGANSAITNQIGYFVESNLTGATNNYGFYGNIGSGSNRWNIYMPGTANNYMAGNLGIGTTTTNSFLNIAAGTTAKAQINLAASTAPTTPNNGDIWFDGTDIKIRVGGVTKTFTLV